MGCFFLAINVLPDFPQNASPDVLPHGKTWARWGFWSSHLQWSGMRLACPKLPECWREKCLPLDSGNVVPSKVNISIPSPWPFWSDDPLNGIFKQWPNKTWTHCPHHTVFSLRRGCGSVKRCLTPIPCDLPGFTKQRISQMLCTICWHKNSLYVCTMNFSPLKPLFFQKSNHDWTTPAGAFCWLTWAAPNKNAGAQTPPEGATNHHTAQNGYKKEHLFESVDVATWPKLFTNGINIWHLEKEWNQVQCLLPFTLYPEFVCLAFITGTGTKCSKVRWTDQHPHISWRLSAWANPGMLRLIWAPGQDLALAMFNLILHIWNLDIKSWWH